MPHIRHSALTSVLRYNSVLQSLFGNMGWKTGFKALHPDCEAAAAQSRPKKALL